MKYERVVWAGFVVLLATACKSQPAASPAPPPETAEIEVGNELVKVERAGLSFADAIKVAAAGREGFTAVAAGVEEGAQGGTRYDVALLSGGRVQDVSVDAATGKLSANEERAVRAGSEAFAAKIEKKLPGAKLDLWRAVEIGLARAEGSRPLGAQVDLDGDQLVYTVTVLAGNEAIEIFVDPVSGEVLRTEAASEMDEDESGETEGRGMEGGETEGGEQGEAGAADGNAVFEVEAGAAMMLDAEDATVIDEDFEDVPAGKLPDGWKIEATGNAAGLASWSVVADDTAPSKGHALALTKTNHDSASAFNVCWTDGIRFKDGAIEVSMKPVSGKEDQGGGLVWRVKDKDDYYICRANPLESNFRVYYVKAGKRHQLASADVEISAGAWHKISVQQDGEHIVCSLDGTKLLDTIDPTFPDEGGVGFWTKSDAVSSFDDLVVISSKEGRGKEDDGDEDDEEMDGERR